MNAFKPFAAAIHRQNPLQECKVGCLFTNSERLLILLEWAQKVPLPWSTEGLGNCGLQDAITYNFHQL